MDRGRLVTGVAAAAMAAVVALGSAMVVPTGAGAATPGPRSGITVESNLCYEPVAGSCGTDTSHLYDAYLPAWPGDAPAVILIHPGAHKAGDKLDVSNIAETLAADGFVAFSINYRLDTPTVPGFPMQSRTSSRPSPTCANMRPSSTPSRDSSPCSAFRRGRIWP